MAEALLITQQDIKSLTLTNGNVDPDKLLPFIKMAQDIHLTRLLGTALIDKLKQDIEDSALEGFYATLVVNYCKPVLIHYTMVEWLPFMAYTVGNKGIYKHQAESSESVSKNEVDYLCERERSTAQHYAQRLIDYICANSEQFPEYSVSIDGGVNSDSTNFQGGWVL